MFGINSFWAIYNNNYIYIDVLSKIWQLTCYHAKGAYVCYLSSVCPNLSVLEVQTSPRSAVPSLVSWSFSPRPARFQQWCPAAVDTLPWSSATTETPAAAPAALAAVAAGTEAQAAARAPGGRCGCAWQRSRPPWRSGVRVYWFDRDFLIFYRSDIWIMKFIYISI